MKIRAVLVPAHAGIAEKLGWDPARIGSAWIGVPPTGSAEIRQGVLFLRSGDRVIAVTEFCVDAADEPPAPRAASK